MVNENSGRNVKTVMTTKVKGKAVITLIVSVFLLFVILVNVVLSETIGDYYYKHSELPARNFLPQSIMFYELHYKIFKDNISLAKLCDSLDLQITFGYVNKAKADYKKVLLYFPIILNNGDQIADTEVKAKFCGTYLIGIYYTAGFEKYSLLFMDNMKKYANSYDIVFALDPVLSSTNTSHEDLYWLISRYDDLLLVDENVGIRSYIYLQEAHAYDILGFVDKAIELENISRDLLKNK